MEKTFEVTHKNKVLTCKITVLKGSRPGKRSQHPDLEDATPRRIEYFYVEGMIELDVVRNEEFLIEANLIAAIPEIEANIRELAVNKINDMTRTTYIEKLEQMGFKKYPSMKEK